MDYRKWREVLNEIDNIIPQGKNIDFDNWISRIESLFLSFEMEIDELNDIIEEYEEQ